MSRVLALRALQAKFREKDAGVVHGGRRAVAALLTHPEGGLHVHVQPAHFGCAGTRQRPLFLSGVSRKLPQVLVHATSLEQAEKNLVNVLEEYLARLIDLEATRLHWSETVLLFCRATPMT